MKMMARLAVGLLVVGNSIGFAASAKDLAKVNSRTITDQHLRNALSGLNEGQRETYLRDPNTRREIILQLIDQELLVEEGEKLKLDQDPSFKEALAQFRRQYLANQVLEKNVGNKLDAKAAEKYFDAHKRRYSTDQARVQHILAADELEAKKLLEEVKKPNADFLVIAEKELT